MWLRFQIVSGKSAFINACLLRNGECESIKFMLKCESVLTIEFEKENNIINNESVTKIWIILIFSQSKI